MKMRSDASALRWIGIVLFGCAIAAFVYGTYQQNVELGRDAEQYLLERVASLDLADHSTQVITGANPADVRVVSKSWRLKLPDVKAFEGRSAELAAVVDARFIQNGYRGYVNVVVREGDDRYSSRQWGLSDSVLWQAGQQGRLVVPFPNGLDLKRTQIEVISYVRMGHERQRVDIRDVAVYKIRKRPDPGAKLLRLWAGFFIAAALALLLIAFRRELTSSVQNSLDAPAGDDRRIALVAASAIFVNPAWPIVSVALVSASRFLKNRATARHRFNRLVAISISVVGVMALASLAISILAGRDLLSWHIVIVGVALYATLLFISPTQSNSTNADQEKRHIFLFAAAVILLSVAMLEAFPIPSNHLRADAWQFDIVARSLADGLGFKSYDVWELGSYPIVPIYFAAFHLVFGQGAVSIVWANATAILAIWVVTYRILARDGLVSIFVAALLFIAWSPFWTAIGWSLSGYLSQLILILIVYVCSLIYQRVQNGDFPAGLLVWLGIAFGVAVLIRTDYYLLLPVLLVWLAWLMGRTRAVKTAAVILVVSAAVAAPWWVFQATHETPYHNVRSSDLSRMVDAALIATGLRSSPDFTPGRFVKNLKNSVANPYLLYVYDVPARRSLSYSLSVHRLMLGFLFLAAFFVFRRQPGIGMWVAALIIALVVWRTSVLALLADLNRHFVHLFPIIVTLISSTAYSLTKYNVRNSGIH